MSESSAIPYMTAEEYLKFEERSTIRHEYVDGYLFAMSGSTDAHNVICGNLFARIHLHLRGTGCRAYINDMKVHVKVANSFYYPDIMVTCEPFAAKSVCKVSPVLIVEVLSPSTKHIDRREKLVAYRKLTSLREYALVHQNRMLIEMHRQGLDQHWQVHHLTKSDELVLESLPGGPLRIRLEDIYKKVEMLNVVEESEEEYDLAF